MTAEDADRFWGCGLTYPSEFGHTHLGLLGRKQNG